MIAAVVGGLALLVQLATLPSLPPTTVASFRTLVEVLKRPMIRVALLVVLLVASGQFAGFTYVRPFLETVPAMPIETISLVLLAYGIGGFFGNFAGAFLAERNLKMAVGLAPLLIALSAAALLVLGASPISAAVAVTAWGFAFGAVPVGLQTWLVRAAPDQAEGAGGLLVAAFQIAIASGAIGGGLLVDHIGALGGPSFAVVALTLGTLLTLRHGPRPAAGGAQ